MMRDFRPINPHGKQAKSSRPILERLYQVQVETRSGDALRIGPKIGKTYAEQLLAVINKSIIEGKERDWSNPHLVACTTTH